MKTKKAFGVASLLVTILAVVFMAAPWGPSRASAVSETCSGVATTFNATAPASVTAGQAFTISGINTSPATSYGFTITTSTLTLSATGATPESYSQANTSTDPSPTTGAQTYTAYYPNWTLTATGAAGSQIVIKLVQASATVEGVGVITCPLTATLVAINVTAPAATPSGGGTSSTPKPTATTTPTTPTPQTTTPTPTTSTETEQTTEDVSKQVVTAKVLVVNGQKHPVKDATVTIDGQLPTKTGKDGIASFTGIRKGLHTITVVYGKQKISREVNVTKDDTANTTFVVSTGPNIFLVVGIGLGGLALLAAAVLLAIRFYKRRY
ncbi:MAG: hypothetical protein QG553_574 [Patescibacteria group bacterium]|nr:hypothetical protein [Patescibacteria group bacterium]